MPTAARKDTTRGAVKSCEFAASGRICVARVTAKCNYIYKLSDRTSVVCGIMHRVTKTYGGVED